MSPAGRQAVNLRGLSPFRARAGPVARRRDGMAGSLLTDSQPAGAGPRALVPSWLSVRVAGWRYKPGAHGARPCTCPGCRVRGGYGARRLRERLPHPLDGPPPPAGVLLETISAAGDPGDPDTVREALHWFGLRRRGPLAQLTRLAAHPGPGVRESLARAVARWSAPGVARLLGSLAGDPHPDVREAVEAVRERL